MFPACNQTLKTNVVYQSDNLDLMRSGLFPSKSIDLVYIDPPFCTQKRQSAKSWSKKMEFGSYDDKFGGGISSYQKWLEDRIQAIYRLLKPDGSLFLHLDYNASHYGKITCDKVFGEGDENKGRKYFMNELIWCYRETSGGRNGNYYKKLIKQFYGIVRIKKEKQTLKEKKTYLALL